MFKENIGRFIGKAKELHGDPHYVALGMAIGVFVSITPTIPFHTILAIVLAIIFKASKPAAYLGVWISNPLTVVFLYVACYKAGFLFFEDSSGGLDSIRPFIGHLESDIHFSQKVEHFFTFFKAKLRIFMIMNVGGVILGVPSGLAVYYVTRNFFAKRQFRRQHKLKKAGQMK